MNRWKEGQQHSDGLVDPKELAHGEQIAEPSSTLHVQLIRRRVELPAHAAEPVQGIHRAARRPVDLHGRPLVAQALRRAAAAHVEDTGVRTQRHQAGPVVHVQPVREHDLREHRRVRSHRGGCACARARRLGDGEAAGVVGRRRLHRRLGRVRVRRPADDGPLAVVLAGVVRAPVDVGTAGCRRVRRAVLALRAALDALLEVRVPVVLHLVVRPARQMPCDLRPPEAQEFYSVRESVI